MTIEGVREYKFDPKKVIEGLNGYYAKGISNSFIRVYRDFVGGPVYLGPDVWLSALIEWLRVDHDIFYYPGMDIRDSVESGLTLDQVEAAKNAAKICGLRAHIKDELSKRDLWFDKNADIPALVDTLFKALDCCDERADENREERLMDKGALSSLKKLHKRVTGEEPEVDSHTLIADNIRRSVYEKESEIEKLKEEIRNAEQKTRNAVNEQLKKDTDYVADVLSTILEALGISKSNTVHLDVFGLKTKAIQRASVIKSEHDRYLEQLDKAAADYQALDKEYRELKSSQKSDANALIRDCCANHGIIAPSRYLSDEASVEYVFSLLDSYSKQRNEACADRDRATAILQNLYRDIFHKDCTQFTYEDIATKILDKVLEMDHQLLDHQAFYKIKLKDYILKDIKKRGYRYDGLETKSIEEVVDWIITMATCANKTVEDVQKETKRECYDYLWNALKKLSPECDALKIDHYEDLVDRIFFEMCFVTENCKQCQRKHSTEKMKYIRRTNKAEEEVKKLNDVIKKLKELLNEINKEEDGEWFKP